MGDVYCEKGMLSSSNPGMLSWSCVPPKEANGRKVVVMANTHEKQVLDGMANYIKMICKDEACGASGAVMPTLYSDSLVEGWWALYWTFLDTYAASYARLVPTLVLVVLLGDIPLDLERFAYDQSKNCTTLTYIVWVTTPSNVSDPLLAMATEDRLRALARVYSNIQCRAIDHEGFDMVSQRKAAWLCVRDISRYMKGGRK